METLGHSQITFRLNTYAHVYAEVQHQEADDIDQLLRSAN